MTSGGCPPPGPALEEEGDPPPKKHGGGQATGLLFLMKDTARENTLKYPGSAKDCEAAFGMALTTDQDNAVLDRIIGKRRSHRRFTQEIPPDAMVEGIIHAGLHAPFAAAAIGNSEDYFRRFVVVRKGSRAMKELVPLAFNTVEAMAGDLERAAAGNPGLREQAAGFMNRLAAIKSMGMVPGIGTAPFYIVAAEKKGFPPVEQLSLAHCMENMWLKATALGLGFQIVSVTAQMADNSEFCRIIGLEAGKWALMGCATGYPADTLSPSIRPSVREVTAWPE